MFLLIKRYDILSGHSAYKITLHVFLHRQVVVGPQLTRISFLLFSVFRRGGEGGGLYYA